MRIFHGVENFQWVDLNYYSIYPHRNIRKVRKGRRQRDDICTGIARALLRTMFTICFRLALRTSKAMFSNSTPEIDNNSIVVNTNTKLFLFKIQDPYSRLL